MSKASIVEKPLHTSLHRMSITLRRHPNLNSALIGRDGRDIPKNIQRQIPWGKILCTTR